MYVHRQKWRWSIKVVVVVVVVVAVVGVPTVVYLRYIKVRYSLGDSIP